MTNLSPAARAVLEAVTWKKYDVPPEGLPTFAEEMAPLIAVALRAAADHLFTDWDATRCSVFLDALADELEDSSFSEPNDLSHLSENKFQSLAPRGNHAP